MEDLQKDEWLHHLNQRFRELGRGVSAATKTNELGLRFEERWFNEGGSSSRVRLRFVNAKQGLFVFIGTRDGGDDGAVADLRDAVTYAIESTGKRRETVAWGATLCQVPARRGLRTMGLHLDEPFEVDDLRVESWGSEHYENVSAWSMGFRESPWHFWPIRVTGKVRCYAWAKDGIELVSARLRVLVELLTLALDWPVEVRIGPYEALASVAMGTEAEPLPTAKAGRRALRRIRRALIGAVHGQSGGQAAATGDEGLLVPGLSAPTVPEDHPWRSDAVTEVPEWVAALLVRSGLDNEARRALSAHYEATLLKADHPSMALLGFVASIETLAVPRKGLPHCPSCKAVLGSGERFGQALASVLSKEGIDLVGKVYSQRSKTVHAAQLHAAEEVLGMTPSHRFFSIDTRMNFEFGTVHLAAKASRRLLLSRLSPDSGDVVAAQAPDTSDPTPGCA